MRNIIYKLKKIEKKFFFYDIILTIKFSIRKERFMYKINELSYPFFDVSTNTIRRYEDYGYISPSREWRK